MDTGEIQSALQLVGALGRFWYLRGESGEGRAAIERALAADSRPTAARGRALHAAATVLANSGDPETGIGRATEAVELHRKLGDDFGVAYSLFLLGNIAIDKSDWDFSRERFIESIEQFEALGEDHFRMLAKYNLAWVYANLGDSAADRRLVDEVYREAQESGNRRMLMVTLSAGAAHKQEDGCLTEALEMLQQALALARETGDRTEVPDLLSRTASVLAAGKEYVAATRLLAKATDLTEELGGKQRSWQAERDAATLATVKANLDEAAFERSWNEGLALSENEALEHGRLAE
jgi:tetratricopeptide (TPR) repeat protein